MSEVDVKETVDNEEQIEKAPAEELVELILSGELHAANQKFNSIVEDKVIEKIEEEKHKISQTLFAEDDDEEEGEDDDDEKKKDKDEVDEAKAKVKEDDEEDSDDDDEDSDDDDEDEDPVGDPKKADEGKIPPQFLKKGKGDDDDDSEEDDKDEKEPVDELSLDTVNRAMQKADDRVYRDNQRDKRLDKYDDSGKRAKKREKHHRQADKFGMYATQKDSGTGSLSGKEKGVGSRTKDPKRKKELIDKASAKAAKAGSAWAKKEAERRKANEEISPETSFDPGEASTNVELPADSFVAQVAAHLSGQRL